MNGLSPLTGGSNISPTAPARTWAVAAPPAPVQPPAPSPSLSTSATASNTQAKKEALKSAMAGSRPAEVVNGIPLSKAEAARIHQDRAESYGDDRGDAKAAVRNMQNLVSLTEQPFYSEHGLKAGDPAAKRLYSDALLTAHASTHYDYLNTLGGTDPAQVDKVFQDPEVTTMLNGFPNHADVKNPDGSVTKDVNFNHMLIGQFTDHVAGSRLQQDQARLGQPSLGFVQSQYQKAVNLFTSGDLAETTVKPLIGDTPEGGHTAVHTGINAGNSSKLWNTLSQDPVAAMSDFASNPEQYSQDGTHTVGHAIDAALHFLPRAIE